MHIVHTQGVQLPPQLTIWGFKWALHHANVKIDVCKHRSGRFKHIYIYCLSLKWSELPFFFALMKSSMRTLLGREDSSPRELNSHDLASIDRYPAKKQFSLLHCTMYIYLKVTTLSLNWRCTEVSGWTSVQSLAFHRVIVSGQCPGSPWPRTPLLLLQRRWT